MRAELSKKLLKTVGRTNGEFELIGEGDKICLALSGGKDSLTLAHILKEMQRRAPFTFEFIAVTVSYGMGEDLSQLQEHCARYEIPYKIYETQIFEIAQDHIRENSSFCSFFSRMRRGALYTMAKELGCNKLALGHHLDDMAESFFMNILYNGSMRALAPKYRADNGIIVIRPLIKVRERVLRYHAQINNFPVIGDEACPSMKFSVKMPYARAKTKELLARLEAEHSNLFRMLATAFAHIHDDTFFEKERFKL
ncbi:MAG: tRNA 2-thiocytidine biosynthesis protein TtcA [Campylobacterales bacterium]